MKTKLIIILIFILFISILNAFAQKFDYPSWIRGVWHNQCESNTDNFTFFIFHDDSIHIAKGLIPYKNSISLNEKYVNYKIIQDSTDSLYTISFSKDTLSVTYEFKLQNVSFSNEPVLTSRYITSVYCTK